MLEKSNIYSIYKYKSPKRIYLKNKVIIILSSIKLIGFQMLNAGKEKIEHSRAGLGVEK
jgi:hypothetical protein